jgi:single-stranded-DNA-specific exonuclease
LRQDGWFTRRAEPDLLSLLDLVAIGTIADLVPLERENRILTRIGLERLRARSRPGLDALLARAGVARGEEIDEHTVAWKIAPRLNAPGRLGDAEPALALLLADAASSEAVAEQLELYNAERRLVQDRVLGEVERELDGIEPGPAVVVSGTGWPSGVVGIVAAKLVERYRRPAFVIAVDPATGIGRGSARTVDGIHLYRVLHDCREKLERYGGHAGAAGLTVRADRVDELRGAIASAVVGQGSGGDAPLGRAEMLIDAEVDLSDVGQRLARELGLLAPFGKGNDAPRLLSRVVEVKSARPVGDGSHLKLELADRDGTLRGAIAFGLADRYPAEGAAMPRVDIVYQPVISSWQGRERVELQVAELAVAHAARVELEHGAAAASGSAVLTEGSPFPSDQTTP